MRRAKDAEVVRQTDYDPGTVRRLKRGERNAEHVAARLPCSPVANPLGHEPPERCGRGCGYEVSLMALTAAPAARRGLQCVVG